MAVNVTEKDKTLNEIIDWCEQLATEGLRLANALKRLGSSRAVLLPLAAQERCQRP